jgi:hypothetical protein
MKYTIDQIKSMDVFSEEFSLLFYTIVEKFANEYDDMSQMKVIQTAQLLLKDLNS